jgi:ABC-type phosphate/phosphonate transport system substrate-binding protein
MERDIVQAGSLRSTLANELIAKGNYETWYSLPTTPDFTLMASDKFSPADQDKLGAAAVALKPEIVKSLQRTIHSKVTGFVVDKQADYKIIKQALKEANYLD